MRIPIPCPPPPLPPTLTAKVVLTSAKTMLHKSSKRSRKNDADSWFGWHKNSDSRRSFDKNDFCIWMGRGRAGVFMFMFMFVFLVADTQLYKRLCPFVGTSVGPSVRWSVRGDRVGKCENAHFRPCPPVRNWYLPCIRPCCFSYSWVARSEEERTISLCQRGMIVAARVVQEIVDEAQQQRHIEIVLEQKILKPAHGKVKIGQQGLVVSLYISLLFGRVKFSLVCPFGLIIGHNCGLVPLKWCKIEFVIVNTRLYTLPCWSVGWLVCWSICQSLCIVKF